MSFVIDRSPPLVSDLVGNLLIPGATNALSLNILAVDPVVNGVAAGLDRIIAEPLDRLLEGVTIQASGLLSKSVRLPPDVTDIIPESIYRIQVYDRAGNVSVIQPIIIDHSVPFAIARGQYSPGASPPPTAVFDGYPNPSTPGCDGNQKRLGVIIGDRVSLSVGDDTGLASLSLRNSLGASQFPGPTLPLNGATRLDLFTSQREGFYDLSLLDVAGNRTEGMLFIDYAPEDTLDSWASPFQEGEEWLSTLEGRVKSSWGLCYVKLVPADSQTVLNATDIDAWPLGHEMLWTPATVSGFTEGTVFQYTLNRVKNGIYMMWSRDLLGVTTQLPIHINVFAPNGYLAQTLPRPFFGHSGRIDVVFRDQERFELDIAYGGVQTPGETTVAAIPLPEIKIVKAPNPEGQFYDSVPRKSNMGFKIYTTVVATGTTRVSISYSTAALTAAQNDGILMYQFSPTGPVDVTVSVDTQTGRVEGLLATQDPFTLIVPRPPSSSTVVSSRLVGGLPELELTSFASSVTVRGLDPGDSEVAEGLLGLRRSAGLAPVGSVFALGPKDTAFIPSASLLVRYSAEVLAPAGIPASSLKLYRSFDAFVTAEELSHSETDASAQRVTAQIPALLSGVTTYVALLGNPTDVTPPQTGLAFAGPHARDAAGTHFVSTRTAISLDASDPTPLAAVASGVAFSSISVNDAPFARFAAAFKLTEEATHAVRFMSRDLAGNMEDVQLASVAVDATPPAASLAISGPAVYESSRVIVGPLTRMSFTASDPVSNGVAAGTAAVVALLDATPESCGLSLDAPPAVNPAAPPASCANPLYESPFAVPAGTHTLAYLAVDNVLNAGVLQSTVVVGDHTPPSAVFQDVPLYTRNPLPPLRAVFTDSLAGVNVSSLSLTLDGTPVPSSVVGTGGLGAWQSAPPLSLPLHAFEVVHLNGWLYSLGGHAGAFQTPRVLLSRLIDGAPQIWADTAPLPRILAAHSAAVLGGRIYTVGGTVAGDGALNSVFYTDPDDATGLISSWQTGPSLPSSLGFLDAVGLGVANRRLYAVGGRDGGGSPRNTVNFSPIDAQTGAPGTWSAATSLPVPLAFSDAVEWNGRIYVAGGVVGPEATDATDRILSIASDSNGQLMGSWRDERVMPKPVYSLEVVVLQGRLYVMGGFDRQNVKQSAVHSAAIAADGTLGPWRAEAPLHRPMGFFGSAATTGALYYAGGDTSTGISADVRWNRLGAGDLASVLVTAVPAAPLNERTYTLAALGADRVANAGSTSQTLTVDFTAPTVALSAGGRALTQGAAQLVAGAAPQLAAAFSDVTSGIDQASIVLLLDGADVTSLAQVTVNGNDTQATYTPTTLAPGLHTLEARAADRAGNATTMTAQFLLDPAPPDVALSSPTSGALFGAGPIALHADFADSLSGLATGTLTLTVDGSTLPATISFDGGGPSGWQTAPSLSLALHAFEVVHLNGWLYSLGGHAGAFQTPRVLLSQLIDGVPQGWNDTTALPSILAGHSAAVLGGRIYTLGGSIVGAPALNTVYYADPADDTGLIAAWNTGASLPSSLGFLDAVGLGVANRHLYAVGGRDGGGSPHRTVFFSPVDLQTGAPGAWNLTTALPVPLAFSDAVEWNGRIYVAGGVVGPEATDATDRILSIASDSNGLLVGSWRDERVMPKPVYSLEVAVLQGRLYVMGGFDRQNVKQSAVHSAAIALDGTLGPWRAEAPLHRPMGFFGSAATTGALYYAGGDTSTGLSADVRFLKAGGQVLVAHASATIEGVAEGGPHVAQASGADLAGNVAVASAAFYVDLSPPLTSLVVAAASTTVPGLVVAPSGSALSLEPRDFPLGTNAGVAATFFAVNGTPTDPPVAPLSLALASGTYLLEFRSVDALGHAESTNTIVLRLDPAAESAAAPDGTATLTADVPVEIATVATEAAPGVFKFAADAQGLTLVLDAYYDLSGGPFAQPATLSFYFDPTGIDTAQLTIFTFDEEKGLWDPGPITGQTLTLISETLALFTGQITHTSIYALMRRTITTDSTPPAVAFAFPRPDEPGLCRLAQGPVAVRGSVSDESLSSWRLTQGSILLGSGTADVQGTLGSWDATGLSGPYSLALSAQDVAGNTAAVSLAVQAGAPARTLALGGKQVLNKPRGVAAGPNRVYVADTNADMVRVFDAAGVPLAVMGDKKGAAKLNKPAGLVLDAAGNILVADANNKRVVKLSPAGVFLAEYGKGVLQRPVAVALSAGRLVVADAKAGQLVVFADAGTLLTRVDLPAAAGPDEDPEEPRPVALAADGAGNVWAADAKGGRVLRYTPELALAQTIPGFERPEGVAVSPSGSCLAVSDSKAARIRTFDAALSAGLAAFGTQGEIKENKALPAEFLLNKPAQLAFDAQGTLLVADRNNDLIQGFGLPGSAVVVAMGTPGRSGGGARLASARGEADEIVASARVGRFEGGRVEHPDGAAVEVSAGAMAQDQDVSVAKAPDSGDGHRVREAARGLAGLAAASGAREFSPHGLNFSEPAVITLPYDPLLAAAPRELKIHYWNEERSAWEALASTVDEGARTVSAQVAHFSVYQVLVPAGAVTTLADPEAGFFFRDLYVFPNPAVGGQSPTFHVAVGKADKVTIRVYDIAGTPAHEVTLDTPSVVNDESGPHWAYEHAWRGHIPSGVYIYVVTAEKAGHAPIKRVGKLAVVR